MKCHPFLVDLNNELSGHVAVNHPFLFKIKDLSVEQTKIFAGQFYLYVRMFPRLMGAIVYNVADEKARLPLILNLINECGGLERMENLDNSQTHPALFRVFTNALGIKDTDLESTKPLPSTDQFIDTYTKLYLESQPMKAMGAVGPGTECAVPRMYIPILDGLRAQNRFDEKQLHFFALHLPIDQEHCDMICDALAPHMDDTINQDMVREGANVALQSRKLFWDGLERAILD